MLFVPTNDTTSPQVLPICGAACATIAAHSCGEVFRGRSFAITPFQSNGSVGSLNVWSVKLHGMPAPALIGLNETGMLRWKPGGNVPNGPLSLKPYSCRYEVE